MSIIDVPSVKMKGGRRLDYDALWERLWTGLSGDISLAVFEDANGYGGNQKMTGSTAFKLGAAAGALQAMITALRIPRHLVTPSAWKKTAGVRGKGDDGKAQARLEAKRRWPESAHLFDRVLDHNRAEAALLADHGLREVLKYAP
jgi:hypothetical protein